MRDKPFLGASAALLAAFTFVGLVGSVGAAPDGSQRLRGLGDRVFYVTVELKEDPAGIFGSIFGVPEGTTFPNCYIFSSDADPDGNNWFETAFPDTVGMWTQDSVGAKTSYSMIANGGGLEQLGHVTPAGGKGVLQFEATTSIPSIAVVFFSVGQEIQGDDIDDCPNGPIFTPPESP